MNAGDLTARITLRHRTATTRTDGGGQTPVYGDLDRVWAKIEPVGARTVNVAKSFRESVSHVVTIRHRRDVDTKMQIDFRGRTFAIDGKVNQPEARPVWLVLYCTEATS